MSESKLNLVASTLTNSLGTTVIGHVATAGVVITMKYANGQFETVTVDESGSFLTKVPSNSGDSVTIEAQSPTQTSKETLSLVIEQPAPVITAVISTQNGQRLLEGQVNQADVSISVHFIGDEHVISLPVDENLEFELVLPDDIVPSQIEVHATSNETGKTGRTIVSLGVTSKTLAMPALTDEMIAEYIRNEEVKQAPQRTNSAVTTDTIQINNGPIKVDATSSANDQPSGAQSVVDTNVNDKTDEPNTTIRNEQVPEESRINRRKRGEIRGFFARLFGKKH